MNREVHVRICERLGVKLPGATRLVREIRTLRAMWRGLESGSRFVFRGTRLLLLLIEAVMQLASAQSEQVHNQAVWPAV
jgi:hypothetical protein